MNPFAGTWQLIKLALRLDRIKLPVWIVAIVGITAASGSALSDLYRTAEERIGYASQIAPSVVGRAFGGPIDGPSLGAITMVELFYFTAVMIAFMSTLTVVRHTRRNEESGAAELVSSGIVGRFASLTAAMVVSISANLIVGGFSFLILGQVDDLSTSGALGMSLALAVTGIAFAGLAAIAAQVSETARGANSIAGAAIGVSFLIRAIGDGIATVSADGLHATAHWISWLSPLGWGFQIHPFTQQNWWLFGLLVGFMVVMVAGAFVLLTRRDVGLGIIPVRSGRRSAKPGLLKPLGLAWHLQRGTLIGWVIGFLVFGVVIGGMANEFASLSESNPKAAESLAEVGGNSSNVSDLFFTAMFNFAGVTAVGYSLQSLLKLRGEETAGRLESVLGTSVSRVKWVFSHLLITVFGSVLLMLIVGVMASIVHVLVGGGSWDDAWRLLPAAMAQLPAILAFIGGVLLLFGIFPRLTIPLAWSAFIGSFLILQLAALLGLPEWTVNISPFTHSPAAPSESITLIPVLSLLATAVVLGVLGLISFKNRDVTGSP